MFFVLYRMVPFVFHCLSTFVPPCRLEPCSLLGGPLAAGGLQEQDSLGARGTACSAHRMRLGNHFWVGSINEGTIYRQNIRIVQFLFLKGVDAVCCLSWGEILWDCGSPPLSCHVKGNKTTKTHQPEIGQCSGHGERASDDGLLLSNWQGGGLTRGTLSSGDSCRQSAYVGLWLVGHGSMSVVKRFLEVRDICPRASERSRECWKCRLAEIVWVGLLQSERERRWRARKSSHFVSFQFR